MDMKATWPKAPKSRARAWFVCAGSSSRAGSAGTNARARPSASRHNAESALPPKRTNGGIFGRTTPPSFAMASSSKTPAEATPLAAAVLLMMTATTSRSISVLRSRVTTDNRVKTTRHTASTEYAATVNDRCAMPSGHRCDTNLPAPLPPSHSPKQMEAKIRHATTLGNHSISKSTTRTLVTTQLGGSKRLGISKLQGMT